MIAAALLGAALIAWVAIVQRMSGMDAGPGTHLGGFAWYVGIWVTMMAAMMLPSAAPMVLVFARVNRERASKHRRRIVPTWFFASTYLLAWVLYGALAYGAYELISARDWGLLAWDGGGPYVAGGAVVAAGVYQLTPLKSVCLRHCRSPMHFVLGGWRDGWTGALRMGLEHGLYCVGCCWGLMLVLWAVGVMSITWMIAIAALIMLEKVTPVGEALSRGLAIAFVALGIWIAAAPGSVPALTEPGSAESSMGMGMERTADPGMGAPTATDSMDMER